MKTRAANELPPSQKSDFIGGHFRSFRKDPTAFLTRQAALGDLSYFRLGPQPAYLAAHPELIRDILVVNNHKFIKGRALQRAKSLLGQGLLTSEGDFHLRQRRMIQPAFHHKRIAGYARSMVEYASKTADSWTDGATLDIDREMMQLTLRIVGQTLFSANVEDDADDVGRSMTTFTSLFNFLLLPFSEWLQKLPLPQSRRFNAARNTMNALIYQIIDQHRRSGTDKGDLLSMLLIAQDEDDGTVMNDEQIRDEVLTLFLAGHETTANALTWTWYLLSQNREAEAKLHAEIDDVLQGRLPSIDDLQNLRYTEHVVAESMRLFPPAWTVGRIGTEDHELNGYHIPKRSLILMSQYVIHHDPRFWENPEAFQPERWEKQSVKEAGQKFIYFPFGGGVRRCIGESFAWTEAILLLAILAQRWKLRIVPEQKFGLSPMITLRPKYGMRMTAEARW